MLPQDIKTLILLYVSDQDLIHVCIANKDFYTIYQNNYFWKLRCLYFFPNDFEEFMNKYNLKEKEIYQLLSQLNHLRSLFPKEFIQRNLIEMYEKKRLDLSGNNIQHFPKEIKFLHYLEELDLSSNRLQVIPKEIRLLFTTLKTLDLFNNKLKSIPKEIGSLVNLQSLTLNYNLLKTLPQEIGSLSNLKYFNLGDNQLHRLPKEIGSLLNLEKLYLSNNPLQTFPKEIEFLRSLKELDLFNTYIETKEIMQFLPDDITVYY